MPPNVPGKRQYNKPKANPIDRAHYGTTHRKLRKQRLAMHPICERCQNAYASCAHHLVYPAVSVDQYQALCRKCHDEIHA